MLIMFDTRISEEDIPEIILYYKWEQSFVEYNSVNAFICNESLSGLATNEFITQPPTLTHQQCLFGVHQTPNNSEDKNH